VNILIDGDIELYKACTGAEEIFTWETDLHTLVSDSKVAKKTMVENITNHQKVIEKWLSYPCSVTVAFSGSNNWRKTVYPDYKSNRVGGRRPIAFKPVKEWFVKNYNCDIRVGLEADDVLGILATGNRDDCVVVSIDKDLQSIPGYLYNPDKQRHPELVSLEQANWFHVYQTLMGDKTDGYPGCPTIGPVRAAAALGKPGEHTTDKLWERAWRLYRAAGRSLEDMRTQAKVARILRRGEWDQEKQLCLWDLPDLEYTVAMKTTDGEPDPT